MFKPFEKITTQRLALVKLNDQDAEQIFEIRSNPTLVKYAGFAPYTSFEQATSYVARIKAQMEKNELGSWSIRLKSNDECIGGICLWDLPEDRRKAEIGYDLLANFHGQGYMQEAASALIQWAFEEAGLERITATLREDNIKSVNVLKRNGFKQKGDSQEQTQVGQVVMMVLYELERNEWANPK